MTYTVTVLTTTLGSELVSAYLMDMGAEGVSIRDKQDVSDVVQNKLGGCFWDYIDDSALTEDDVVHVVGYFACRPGDEEIKALGERLAFAEEMMPVDMGLLHVAVGESTDDEDWLNNWKAFYQPIDVGNITVVPAWMQSDATHIVKINPSMAFGTGEHESTRMCLELLQKLPLKGKMIIDVGCGSGILGLAALRLGADYCYFADIDADAVKNMRENADLNGITRYEARVAPLLEGCTYQADVMLANITADILKLLSSDAARCLKDGGYLVLSGIIAEREQEVLDAFVSRGFRLLDKAEKKDWRALLMQK